MRDNTMKVVILGGTGVLSTGITKKCLEENMEVIHFNRANNKSKYPVKTIVGNRNNKEDLIKIRKMAPDIIVDMLCFDERSAKMSVDIFRGCINQYIFCSTSCVYTPVNKPVELTETSETNPLTEYGRNKLKAEKVFMEADRNGYFHTTIFRPGHVFSDTFTVNHLTLDGLYILGRMKRDLDVILTDRGNNHIQACHSDNIGLAFAKSCGNYKCYGNVYNIAGEERMSWNELYRTELQILNSRSKICYMDIDKVVHYDINRLDYLNTFSRFQWIQNLDRLKADIPEYIYEVNFKKGITSTIHKNYSTLINNKNEDDLYKKLFEL